MSGAQQRLLVRALTDAALCKQLTNDRGEVLGIDAVALDRFAESLVERRLSEARHALSLRERERFIDFDRAFRAYALVTPRPTSDDRRADARRFVARSKRDRFGVWQSRFRRLWTGRYYDVQASFNDR